MRKLSRNRFFPALLLALAGAAAFAFFALRTDRVRPTTARLAAKVFRAGGGAGLETIAATSGRSKKPLASEAAESGAPPTPAASGSVVADRAEDWRTSPRLWLFSEDDRDRVQALIEAFAAALQRGNWKELEHLSKAFRDLGGRAVAPLLDVLVRDPDDRMRIYAAAFLGEIQESVPAGLLREALRAHALPLLEEVASSSEDPSLRHSAFVAIGKIGDHASLDFLADAVLRVEGWPMVDDVIEALGKIRDDGVTAEIADLAERESDPRVRERLARALGEREDPAAAGPLEDLATRDLDPGVRAAAAAALGDLGSGAGDRALRDIVGGQDDASVRAAAAQALGRPDNAGAVDFLRGVLGSTDDPEVRSAAWRALGTIGTEEAREAIAPYRPAVRVDGVIPWSQAQRLKLSSNDVITSYNGKPVRDAGTLRRLVLSTPPEQVVPLVVDHGGWTRTFFVHGGLLGIRVQDGVLLD